MAVGIVHFVGVAVQPLQGEGVRCEEDVVVQVEVARFLVVDMELKRTRSETSSSLSTSAPPRTSQPSERSRSGECPSPHRSPNPIPPTDCRHR